MAETADALSAPEPVITHSRAIWLGEKRFEAGPDGRTHVIDAGAKVAPGPVETLLSAIATCSAVDVLAIMQKRRTPVERLQVDVVGTRRPATPRRLMQVELTFGVDGADLEVDQVLRAAQLSLEKYCSVAASLGPDVELTAMVVVNGMGSEKVRIASWVPAEDGTW